MLSWSNPLGTKDFMKVYKKLGASKPHLLVMGTDDYEESQCKTLETAMECHVDLEHKDGTKYIGTVSQIYFTLSEEVISQMTCNNVVPGKKYPAL